VFEIRRATRLETVRKHWAFFVGAKLAASKRRDGSQVRAGRAAVDEGKDFVDFEVQHVARRIEHANCVKSAPELEKDLSHAREQACPLETQVLAVADPAARVLQNPAQDLAADGVASECL
jgi:hypothetical protein